MTNIMNKIDKTSGESTICIGGYKEDDALSLFLCRNVDDARRLEAAEITVDDDGRVYILLED